MLTGKNLRNKSGDLRQLRFSVKLFVSESMCHENHQLVYKCCQLKFAGKIHSTWFWSNVINVKLGERSNLSKLFVSLALKNFLALTFWMILLTKLHFKCSHLLLRCVFHYMFSTYSNDFLSTIFLIMLTLSGSMLDPILLDSETAIFNIFKLINCKTFSEFFIKCVNYFL